MGLVLSGEAEDRKEDPAMLAPLPHIPSLPIATGKWGGGVFNGNAAWKSVVQWLAASAGGRPSLTFFTFGDEDLASQLSLLAQACHTRRPPPHTGELWRSLLKCGDLILNPATASLSRTSSLHRTSSSSSASPALARTASSSSSASQLTRSDSCLSASLPSLLSEAPSGLESSTGAPASPSALLRAASQYSTTSIEFGASFSSPERTPPSSPVFPPPLPTTPPATPPSPHQEEDASLAQELEEAGRTRTIRRSMSCASCVFCQDPTMNVQPDLIIPFLIHDLVHVS
eukprot:TRINITY_DN1909_c0_g2_i5.p1 TRINITY_DN1909_c0_g2~~TRINITY_DN1909_c0_g2_i5.p1  ORF type:complete len:286 (+),score=40.96 TRINITY_DN1909_c0_g2_i5:170-1027(+)